MASSNLRALYACARAGACAGFTHAGHAHDSTARPTAPHIPTFPPPQTKHLRPPTPAPASRIPCALTIYHHLLPALPPQPQTTISPASLLLLPRPPTSFPASFSFSASALRLLAALVASSASGSGAGGGGAEGAGASRCECRAGVRAWVRVGACVHASAVLVARYFVARKKRGGNHTSCARQRPKGARAALEFERLRARLLQWTGTMAELAQ